MKKLPLLSAAAQAGGL